MDHGRPPDPKIHQLVGFACRLCDPCMGRLSSVQCRVKRVEHSWSSRSSQETLLLLIEQKAEPVAVDMSSGPAPQQGTGLISAARAVAA
eukprot:COSAG01_NODE_81_length_27820_cov_22.659753_9_plen_89_part_00